MQFIPSSGGGGASPPFAITDTTGLRTDLDGKMAGFFGDGFHGALNITSTDVIITQDMYYTSIAWGSGATGRLITSGFRVFANTLIDFTNAPENAIIDRAKASKDGGNASTQTGGANGSSYTAGTVGAGAAATLGATGTTGAGAQGAAATAGTGFGGDSGASGAGGTASGGATAGELAALEWHRLRRST